MCIHHRIKYSTIFLFSRTRSLVHSLIFLSFFQHRPYHFYSLNFNTISFVFFMSWLLLLFFCCCHCFSRTQHFSLCNAKFASISTNEYISTTNVLQNSIWPSNELEKCFILILFLSHHSSREVFTISYRFGSHELANNIAAFPIFTFLSGCTLSRSFAFRSPCFGSARCINPFDVFLGNIFTIKPRLPTNERE